MSKIATIDAAVLKGALDKIRSIVPKRNTIPILDNVLIQSDHNLLSLTVTDLDIAIRVTLPAEVEEGFSTTVSVHRLSDFMKTAAKGALTTLTLTDHNILVNNGGPAVTMPVLPIADFPMPDEVVKIQGEIVSDQYPGQVFRDGLDATKFAISTEETRYYLNGVYIHNTPDGLVMVATDGHRLHKQQTNIQNHLPDQGDGLILPRNLVNLLLKLMKGKDCPSTFTFEHAAAKPNRVRLAWDNTRIWSKTIDGTFPDYTRVIPRHNENLAKIDCAALVQGINTVAAVSTERSRGAKFTFNPESGLQLFVNNPEGGEAKCDLAATIKEPLEIGFNTQYVKDIASASGGGDLHFEFDDAGAPAVVRGSREGWMGVLMPMRI